MVIIFRAITQWFKCYPIRIRFCKGYIYRNRISRHLKGIYGLPFYVSGLSINFDISNLIPQSRFHRKCHSFASIGCFRPHQRTIGFIRANLISNAQLIRIIMENHFSIADQLCHFTIDAVVLIPHTINDIDAYCYNFRASLAICGVFIGIIRILRRILLNRTHWQLIACYAIYAVNLNGYLLIGVQVHQQINIRQLRRFLRAGPDGDHLRRTFHLKGRVVVLVLVAVDLSDLLNVHLRLISGIGRPAKQGVLFLHPVYIGGNRVFLVNIEDLAVFHQVIHAIYRHQHVPVDFMFRQYLALLVQQGNLVSAVSGLFLILASVLQNLFLGDFGSLRIRALQLHRLKGCPLRQHAFLCVQGNLQVISHILGFRKFRIGDFLQKHFHLRLHPDVFYLILVLGSVLGHRFRLVSEYEYIRQFVALFHGYGKFQGVAGINLFVALYRSPVFRVHYIDHFIGLIFLVQSAVRITLRRHIRIAGRGRVKFL